MQEEDFEEDIETSSEDIQQNVGGPDLLPLEKFLEAGVHIGSRFKSGDMRRFVYKCRNDGLCVLDISMLKERIATAAHFIASYEGNDILVVAGRAYAQKPAMKMAEAIGARHIVGRFVPGTLTNPNNDAFIEPKLLVAADPPVDKQAIREAITSKIPVVSLCDTSNRTSNIDMVIPINNKGKKALALVYWLLTREILKERGMIKSYDEFTTPIEDFESGRGAERKKESKEEQQARRRKK